MDTPETDDEALTRLSAITPDNIIILRPDGSAPDEHRREGQAHPMKRGTPRTVPVRQCTARTRAGVRCRRYPIAGGTVCRVHGGAAPQVKRAAQLRLLELIAPAIGTLAREMMQAPQSADRQRAANSILDRAGVVRSTGPDGDLARALLIDRLMTLKETGQ